MKAAPLVLIAAVVLACGTPPPDAPELGGRVEPGSMVLEDRERTWLLYEPASRPTPAPLVMVLPGSSQDAAVTRQISGFRFEELAERDAFLVVYAEAWAEGGIFGAVPEWNDCRKNTDLPAHNLDVDDVGFLVALVDRLIAERGVDPRRVYATGLSDGGQMSYRLATEHPDRFAAVAILVAQQAAPENSNCLEPRGPIPVMVMNGTHDPIIPYEGGEASLYGFFSAGRVQAMPDTLAHWRAANGLDGPPVVESLPDRDPDDGSSVERAIWRDAMGAREVVGYTIRGGGHTFPGGWQYGPPALIGRTNRDIHAADEIWGFFSRHRH